jgi:Lipocalin-like domain
MERASSLKAARWNDGAPPALIGGKMNQRSVLNLLVVTLFGLLALPPGAAFSQQRSLKDQLIGSWTYVSSTARLPDGSPLWGSDPKGLLILTDDGHFSWQVFHSDRPKFVSNKRLQATTDENSAAMKGSLAYFGTYSVNEADKTVSFHISASTFPNSEGEDLKRIITGLSVDELEYINPATTLGARVEAVWKRAK